MQTKTSDKHDTKVPSDQSWHFECDVKMINIYISGGPLSALTCCVNVRLLSGDKKNIAVNLFSKLGWELGLYYASYDDFHPDILARMYTKPNCTVGGENESSN